MKPCTHCIFLRKTADKKDQALIDIMNTLFEKMMMGELFTGSLWLKGRRLRVESTRHNQQAVLMIFLADH